MSHTATTRSLTSLISMAFLLGAVMVSPAALITFSGLNANNSAGTLGGYNITNPNVTHSFTLDGLDRVYSYTVAGLDLDGGGSNNDTLSWDMRHQAFNDGTINVNGNDSSVTLGAAFGVDPSAGVNYGMADDGDGVEDLDANDSMRWSIENINLTVDMPGAWVADFQGFTGAFLTGGATVDYILGEGSGGLTSIDAAVGSANFTFAAQTTLTLTTDTNNRGIRSLVGSFETSLIPEPSSLGLLGAAFGILAAARRRRSRS